MEDDNDVDPPTSSPPAILQVPEMEVVPNSDVESHNEADTLSIGNVLSNIANINNTSKESPINLYPIGVYECTQLLKDLG